MIITRSEVKSYLQITSTTHDTFIDTMIPVVINEMMEYTNNYFENNRVRITSPNITCSSSANTIVWSQGDLSTWNFQSGDEIRVQNSLRNDGVYTGTTISSGTITLSSMDQAVNESSWTNITITKIDVPKALKPVLAKMIKFQIDQPNGMVQSESLGDYSVTFGQSGNSQYPASITAALNRYSLVKFV